MADLLLESMALNEEAVRLTLEGQLNVATPVFQKALVCVKQTLANLEVHNDPTRLTEQRATDTCLSYRAILLPQTPHERSDGDSSAFAVFDKLFLVEQRPARTTASRIEMKPPSTSTKQQCELLSATYVYNFALVNHRACGTPEGIRLAHHLYQCAYQIAEHLEHIPHARNLLLATTNNLAAIELEFCLFSDFEQRRQVLQYLLMRQAVHSGAHHDGFLMSLFSLNLCATVGVPQQRPAAAA